MTHTDNERAASDRGRLPSIFDAFPPGSPVTLDDLELAMHEDTERRTLAALDRVLGGRSGTPPATLTDTRPAAPAATPPP